jgi:hypothetical protein
LARSAELCARSGIAAGENSRCGPRGHDHELARLQKSAAARRQTPKELVDPSGGALDTMPVLREFLKSFRVVFYNDTIGGKAEVERNLSKHLEAITGR